ncbi:helix-turn-helix domain-containing protein [Mycobacteroides salmoniphilum]|uniref:helix-turn-helix domain-containing protein n=1 Tax=Mycobacteroides salmoniphilum TaxID=404941 RepID=UPI001F196180|nr:helix-turn-helix domain-containing protein [Mycobacteroides salmoniphilum]
MTTDPMSRLMAMFKEIEGLLAPITEATKVAVGSPVLRPNRRKLTGSDVREIRDMYRKGWKQKDLAYSFDVNPATISRIVRRQYHKGVQ